jgi:RNA polymerase sigma-70 factor, ECF subfamily
MSLAIDWVWLRRGENPFNYLNDVYRYAMARLNHREDAEDIAIEVVQSLPNPCRRHDLRVYMLGIAKRKIADRYRRLKPADEIRETDLTGRFDHQADEATFVTCVMQNLTLEHREVLVLKYVVGMSSAEIGKVMSKKPEAVDSLLQRAREAFGRHWEDLSSDEVK